MSLNANDKKYESENKRVEQPPLEVGTYLARLVQLIGLGLQKQEYNGEAKDPKNEIRTVYELVDEFCVDEEGNELEDKPRWLGEDFTMNSLRVDKAKSTQRYLAFDPGIDMEGDWTMLIGAPVGLTVKNNEGKGKNAGRIFNNVGSLTPMREKEANKLPELVNPSLIFDFYNPDVEVFLSLPNFVQDKIKSALNFEGSPLEKLLEEHEDGPKGGDTKKTSKAAQKSSEKVSDTKETDNDDGDW